MYRRPTDEDDPSVSVSISMVRVENPVDTIKSIFSTLTPLTPFPSIDRIVAENEGILNSTTYELDGSSLFHACLSQVGFVDPLIVYLFLEQADNLITAADNFGLTPLHRLVGSVAYNHLCYINREDRIYLPIPHWDPFDLFQEILDVVVKDKKLNLAKVVNKEKQNVLHFALSINKRVSCAVIRTLVEECPDLLKGKVGLFYFLFQFQCNELSAK